MPVANRGHRLLTDGPPDKVGAVAAVKNAADHLQTHIRGVDRSVRERRLDSLGRHQNGFEEIIPVFRRKTACRRIGQRGDEQLGKEAPE